MEKEQKIQRDAKNRQKIICIIAIVCILCFVGAISTTDGQNRLAKVAKNVRSLESKDTEDELLAIVESLDKKVREIKKTGVIMETDEASLEATGKLQDATRKLLAKRYGPAEPYRVRVDLEFQPSIPDFEENGPDGSILIEMGPSSLIPHSVYTFMEEAKNWMTGVWQVGAFHRVANHVLQVTMGNKNPVKHLAFQEYHKAYPHKKGTVGYCGRPSGPCWYASIQDNTRNHGPGSQQKHNPYEADACFGKIIEGFEDVVVKRITKMPGHEFINDPKKHVLIKKMTIYVPGNGPDGYVEWEPTT